MLTASQAWKETETGGEVLNHSGRVSRATYLEVVSVEVKLQRLLEQGPHPVGDLGVGEEDLGGGLVVVVAASSSGEAELNGLNRALLKSRPSNNPPLLYESTWLGEDGLYGL